MAHLSRKKSSADSHEESPFQAIGTIYDAALSPDLWPEALSRIARLCGARWAIFSVAALDPFVNRITVQNLEADPEQRTRMIGRYVMPTHNPSIPVLLASSPGQIKMREEQFSDREWEHMDLYQEVYRPFNLYGAIAVPLVKTARYFVPMGLGRAKGRKGFEAGELAALSRIVPHLQRAIQMMLRLDRLEAHAGAMHQVWDRLSCGVVALDAVGRILWSNRAGEDTIGRNDAIYAKGGMLFAAANETNAELHRLINQAARAGSDAGLQVGGGLCLPRRPPARPLSILALPLRARVLDAFQLTASSAVILIIVDPDQRRDLPETLLMRLYRLTRAEAAVAVRIAAGMAIKQAAGELEISANTARLHLQRVMDKTGAHRQSDLVRLLLTSIPLEV